MPCDALLVQTPCRSGSPQDVRGTSYGPKSVEATGARSVITPAKPASTTAIRTLSGPSTNARRACVRAFSGTTGSCWNRTPACRSTGASTSRSSTMNPRWSIARPCVAAGVVPAGCCEASSQMSSNSSPSSMPRSEAGEPPITSR